MYNWSGEKHPWLIRSIVISNLIRLQWIMVLAKNCTVSTWRLYVSSSYESRKVSCSTLRINSVFVLIHGGERNNNKIISNYFKKNRKRRGRGEISNRINWSELKTLELGNFNADRLIWISTVDTFKFCLIRSILYPYRIPTNKSSLIERRAKYQISRLLIDCSGICIRYSY